MENIDLAINNELENKNNINIYEKQRSFLESDLGRTINSALDIGLKAALPNLIEDQVIEIKNTILEQGFKEGIKEVINSGIEIGKSITGVVTGNFENISQVQLAIKNGGVLDSVSKLLDMSINLAKSKNLINNSIAKILKQSKNTIINSVSDKIEETLSNQLKSLEKLEKYCDNWKVYYENRNFSWMEKSYRSIENYLNKVMPLENTINEARKIQNIHSLIKNNGKNFDISNNELELAQKLI